MEVARGEVWWADLPDAADSSPAGTRPVLVIQSKAFNRSRLQTVITAVVTSNLALAYAPGNVEVGPRESGLPKPSVINVSQLFTIDKHSLRSRAGRLRPTTMDAVSEGLRIAMAL
ncbi:MAG TPA: type II toxin-antitoxin system PemK/MazF family toxin [Thermoanaerobaculia bacterium]|jgi:mRNA interferase MazF|nr:type II toxin-antitoxin system PemK/MazF family toxin [Thermoanaerobaculia bacterium]